jgi:hypothetical protein
MQKSKKPIEPSIIERKHQRVGFAPFFSFNYRVYNFSGILAIEDWHQHRMHRNTFHTMDKNYPLPYIELDIIGCYFILNAQKEVIYIGKSTSCVRNRLMNHIFHTIHKSGWTKESYRLEFNKKQQESVYFAFFEVEKSMVEGLEAFLIAIYKPKYNYAFNKFSEPNRKQFQLLTSNI